MAKEKPQRQTSIDSTIEKLKHDQEIILKDSTEITLVNIEDIHELKLKSINKITTIKWS